MATGTITATGITVGTITAAGGIAAGITVTGATTIVTNAFAQPFLSVSDFTT